MRTPALILAAAAVTLLMAPASPQDKVNPPPKERVEESARKVRELRKERIAILKELVDTSLKLALAARVEVWEAMEDRMTLLKAELEAAEKESDRITLYTKAIDSLKQYEQVARARLESGRGTATAVLRIKATRLEVEIQSEQAKAREAKGGK
jgi:hypothetical protein